MPFECPIRLVLVTPPAGIDFAIQRGRGAKAESVLVQRSTGRDIAFDFSLTVLAGVGTDVPHFTGPFAQGPPSGRFIYIGVGTLAGQKDTPWSRRIKVPLQGITATLLRSAAATPRATLQARIPGTGKDGSPSCATTRPLGGWEVIG